MKIIHQGVIGSVTAKVDRSISYRVSTPELSADEKARFMDMQNVNCTFILEPIDEENAPELVINEDLETKTPSQRLRNSLYVLYTQKKPDVDFDIYYRTQMEKFIEVVKSKLDE